MARRLCLSVFLPPKLFCLQEDLQHEANQGAVPVVSWPSSELGCLTGSCRDEASFLGCLRLLHFWTRYPGTAEAFCGAVLLALWFVASASTLLQEGPGSPVHVEQSALDTTPFSKGRVDCRRLRQRQCDRTPPLSLRTFCAAPLLSCQRLGTSRTQERMDAAIWPSARKYPPNAGPDVRPSVFSCYGVPLRAWDGYPLLRGRPVHRPPSQTCFQDKAQVGTPWTQVQKSRPTSSVPPRCLAWYGSTTHLGAVVKRTRLLCYGCRATATALPVVFVTVLLPTGSGSARSDGLCALTTNHPYGPSLVVGSYLVWDATRRELWETALLSTTRRLPVREYWTQ